MSQITVVYSVAMCIDFMLLYIVWKERQKMNNLTLDKLAIGQTGIIQLVGGEGILRRRLLDMGLTPRTRVMVRKRAPLGDPMEIFLRGYELTLRADEASKITVVLEVDN